VITISITGINGANSYSPANANVKVGDQVRFRNDHNIMHTATQSGGFDTGTLQPGNVSAPITMTTAGTINYFCKFHTMSGVLTVTQ
jgi:plastocyanin